MIALALAVAALAIGALPQHVQIRPAAASLQNRIAVTALADRARIVDTRTTRTFVLRLTAAQLGGIPRDVHARLDFLRPAAAGSPVLVEVTIDGALIAARRLQRAGSVEHLNVAIPAAFVGTDDQLDVRVASTRVTLLPSSELTWSGVRNAAATVADFVKIAHGRLLVAIDPGFRAAAEHVVNVMLGMNTAIASIDVRAFDGTVPQGYDTVLVFADPRTLAARFALPLHGGDASFRIVNPLDDSVIVGDAESGGAATIQVGRVNDVPLMAFSYVADRGAIARIGSLDAGDLAVQVGNVALVTPRGVTAYEVGPKLRVRYDDDNRLANVWQVVRLPVALVLLTLLVAGGISASRRLARKPVVPA